MAGCAKALEEEALRRFDSSFRREGFWPLLIPREEELGHLCKDTVFLYQQIFLFGIFLGAVCPASAVAHARVLAAHCHHSHAEFPRQCEADMSKKLVPHHEETEELEI